MKGESLSCTLGRKKQKSAPIMLPTVVHVCLRVCQSVCRASVHAAIKDTHVNRISVNHLPASDIIHIYQGALDNNCYYPGPLDIYGLQSRRSM